MHENVPTGHLIDQCRCKRRIRRFTSGLESSSLTDSIDGFRAVGVDLTENILELVS